jgi:hypothetical protein
MQGFPASPRVTWVGEVKPFTKAGMRSDAVWALRCIRDVAVVVRFAEL